jgi:hypothetical protein
MAPANTCTGIFKFDDIYKALFTEVIKPLVEVHTGLTYRTHSLLYYFQQPICHLFYMGGITICRLNYIFEEVSHLIVIHVSE